MNEQLVVKNFGPITDATVDFKRVTVFIGPTGGGKSTLAKLAAIFRDSEIYRAGHDESFIRKHYEKFSIDNFFSIDSDLQAKSESIDFIYRSGRHALSYAGYAVEITFDASDIDTISKLIENLSQIKNIIGSKRANEERKYFLDLLESAKQFPTDNRKTNTLKHKRTNPPHLQYIPAERVFIPSIEYSWAGLLRDDIGLPKNVLDFANNFSLSRKDVPELDIQFLNVKYLHRNGQDFIKIPESETLFRLYETASGIQSVTPLLVLLEHLSRNTEQAQSFIIEEPELNLYPTAQQGLLNWLVEKCTKGENDLTITTHSPYLLAHFNLLLYAYQVAEQHPNRREEVAAIVPEASWINPKEFACYQVENGGVQSLVDDDLGLIDNNELDALSGDAADAFDNLIRLSKAVAAK